MFYISIHLFQIEGIPGPDSTSIDMGAYQGLALSTGWMPGQHRTEVLGEPSCTFMPNNCTVFCLLMNAIS